MSVEGHGTVVRRGEAEAVSGCGWEVAVGGK